MPTNFYEDILNKNKKSAYQWGNTPVVPPTTIKKATVTPAAKPVSFNAYADTDWGEKAKNSTDANTQNQALSMRATKEAQMRKNGTWDNTWKSTADMASQLGSNLYNNSVQKASINPYAAAQQETERRLASMKQNQIGQANDAYGQANKNAYIAYEQSKANLPEVLAAQGNTGGMAESTASKIYSSYGNNINQNMLAKNQSVNDINMSYDQQSLQYANEYADKIIGQQNVDRSFNYGVSRDKVGDARYTDETNYGRGRDTLSDNRYTDETAYSRGRNTLSDERYTDETAYSRNRDTVGDERYSQEWNYNVGRDNVNDNRYADETTYSRGRDALSDTRYIDETAYGRKRDTLSDSRVNASGSGGGSSNGGLTELQLYNLALGKAEKTGDYSGMGEWGWSNAEIAAANKKLNPLASVDGSAPVKAYNNIPSEIMTGLASKGITPGNAYSVSSAANWTSNPVDLGYGMLSDAQIESKVESGELLAEIQGNKIVYRKNPNYSKAGMMR